MVGWLSSNQSSLIIISCQYISAKIVLVEEKHPTGIEVCVCVYVCARACTCVRVCVCACMCVSISYAYLCV